VFATIVLTVVAPRGAAAIPPDPEGSALLQEAQRMIAAYHQDFRASHRLRVVYFQASDRDPLPNYAERLDRVMSDISDFYRDGLRRFGIETEGLPLERKDGRLVIHVVHGAKSAREYRHDSGYPFDREEREANEAVAEIRTAMKGTFDLEDEWVLVIYGLCRREPDGTYVFDGPYFGDGTSNHRRGLCHAADCELLDPPLLRDTKRELVYTEHYHSGMHQSVAQFNSWYLGGIAHELGHGLGVSHDAGSLAERAFGVSLMGGGNLNYRADVWGGASPAYLSRASALQLMSHPLFTRSDHGRWDEVLVRTERFDFSSKREALEIRGRIVAEIPAYAVIAHVRLVTDEEHDTPTFPVVLHDGAFSVPIDGLRPRGDNGRPNRYWLRIVTAYVNGATTTHTVQFGFDPTGKPDDAALNAAAAQW
jgi:hypothetical protein